MNALNRYAFEDRVAALATIHWANFFLAGLCLFNNLPSVFQHPQFQWSLFTAIVFLGLYSRYDWRRLRINRLILFTYLSFLPAEYLISGLPATGMDAPQVVSKGVMLDVVVIGAPVVYLLVKLFLIFPLVRICSPSLISRVS